MILFRADGNADIGAGHIMRCLSIADASQMAGKKCLFVTASKDFSNIIQEHRHENIVLNTSYNDMFSEFEKMEELINKYLPSALFIDSYYVTYDYLDSLQQLCHEAGSKLIYIDDIIAFAYPCDILVNYNIYGSDKEKKYRYLYQEKNTICPQLLLGTKYTPLRKEFQNLQKRVVNRQVQNVLVSTGGSDPEHIALGLVRYIVREGERFKAFHFYFIIGSMNDDRWEIERIAADSSYVSLHYNVQFMQKLMSCMDLAISAAGSTLYELCATQTPTITYILADNQVLGAEEFHKRHILQCVGDIRIIGEELPKLLLDEVIRLSNDYEERVKIAEKQRLIVDGKGAMRIMQVIAKM